MSDAEVGYRCVRGEDCPDYRPGLNHAHGFTGAPDLLARNHAAGCARVIVADRPGSRASCACGAAVRS